MSSSSTSPYLRAAILGTIAGIRSMSAPALVSREAFQSKHDFGGGPLDNLASPAVSALLDVAAVGEMVVDKLPFLPNRTDALPLLGRVILGGSAGAVLFIEEKQPPIVGALISGAAAVVSTQISFRLRRALSKRLPGLLAALTGDAAVFVLGRAYLNTGQSES